MGSVICSGCGINMRAFQTNEEKINNLIQENYENHLEGGLSNPPKKDIKEQNGERSQYRKRTLAAILISISFGLLVIAISLLFGYQLDQRQNKAAEFFASAQFCFENENYECAAEAVLKAKNYGYNEEEVKDLQVTISLDSAKEALSANLPDVALVQLETCLAIQPNNLSCVQTACTAQTLIAERYAATARWEDAVYLLDEIITNCPNVIDNRSFQEEIFNSWYEDAIRHSNLLETNKVKRLWYARFPKE